jgi:hypothetical protein
VIIPIKFKLFSLISLLSHNTLHFYILNHNSFTTQIRYFFILCLSDFAHNQHNLLSLLYFSTINDKKKLSRFTKLHSTLFYKIQNNYTFTFFYLKARIYTFIFTLF